MNYARRMMDALVFLTPLARAYVNGERAGDGQALRSVRSDIEAIHELITKIPESWIRRADEES